MLIHEQAHAKQLHTLDILFAEMLTWGLWINPVSRMYKNTISENHEYLVDDKLIIEGTNALDYSKEIIDAVSNITAARLVSGFSYIQTRNRLTMISKSRSNKYFGMLKMNSLLLLFGGLYLLNSCNDSSRWPEIADDKGLFEKFQSFQDIEDPKKQYEALRTFGINMTDEELEQVWQHRYDDGDLNQWIRDIFRSWVN